MTDGEGRVLVVEDDPDIRKLLLFNLGKDGYDAFGAANGEEGLRLFAEKAPDLVILDLMLPGMDGMAVCRRIRRDAERGGVPILMLTARSGEDDMVSGLEAGADDYVPKPFSNRVLLARVRTLLRRGGRDAGGGGSGSGSGGGNAGTLTVGPLSLNPERREATVFGRPVELTAGEFKTLQVMMRRPGVVFTRAQLLDLVRGNLHAVTDRAVDVQVASLRKKLDRAGSMVETVRGAGYRVIEGRDGECS